MIFLFVILICLLFLLVVYSFVDCLFGDKHYSLVVFADFSCCIFKTKLSRRRINKLRIEHIGNPIISILEFNDFHYLRDYIANNKLKNFFEVLKKYEK